MVAGSATIIVITPLYAVVPRGAPCLSPQSLKDEEGCLLVGRTEVALGQAAQRIESIGRERHEHRTHVPMLSSRDARDEGCSRSAMRRE